VYDNIAIWAINGEPIFTEKDLAEKTTLSDTDIVYLKLSGELEQQYEFYRTHTSAQINTVNEFVEDSQKKGEELHTIYDVTLKHKSTNRGKKNFIMLYYKIRPLVINTRYGKVGPLNVEAAMRVAAIELKGECAVYT
jgi:hypothetical protein